MPKFSDFRARSLYTGWLTRFYYSYWVLYFGISHKNKVRKSRFTLKARVMRKIILPFGIKPTHRRPVVLVGWNSIRESLNARYAAREMFPSIMISFHYFVIPSLTEFPAFTNRYINAPAPIHICLRNIAESSAVVRRNSNVLLARHYSNFSISKHGECCRKKIRREKLLHHI